MKTKTLVFGLVFCLTQNALADQRQLLGAAVSRAVTRSISDVTQSLGGPLGAAFVARALQNPDAASFISDLLGDQNDFAYGAEDIRSALLQKLTATHDPAVHARAEELLGVTSLQRAIVAPPRQGSAIAVVAPPSASTDLPTIIVEDSEELTSVVQTARKNPPRAPAPPRPRHHFVTVDADAVYALYGEHRQVRPLELTEEAWEAIGETARDFAFEGYLTLDDFKRPKISLATSRKYGVRILILESETGYPYFFSMKGKRMVEPDTRPFFSRLGSVGEDDFALDDGRLMTYRYNRDEDRSYWSLPGSRPELSKYFYGPVVRNSPEDVKRARWPR